MSPGHLPVHTYSLLALNTVFFFFYGGSPPQRPYGLLGTGEEWGRE